MTTPEMRQYMIDNKMLADAAMNSVISETAGRRLFSGKTSASSTTTTRAIQ